MQLHTKCAALKNLCNSEVYYLVVQECKKINSCRNVKFRHELIGEIQP